jgi:hypothetical protein
MVSETFGTVHGAQSIAQGTGHVIRKRWWALLAGAREFVAAERAHRYALHVLVLGIAAVSFAAVVW